MDKIIRFCEDFMLSIYINRLEQFFSWSEVLVFHVCICDLWNSEAGYLCLESDNVLDLSQSSC